MSSCDIRMNSIHRKRSKRKERLKINGIRIGLAFGGAISGMYHKLQHINQQLKRDVSMLHMGSYETMSEHSCFANYKEYMQTM